MELLILNIIQQINCSSNWAIHLILFHVIDSIVFFWFSIALGKKMLLQINCSSNWGSVFIASNSSYMFYKIFPFQVICRGWCSSQHKFGASSECLTVGKCSVCIKWLLSHVVGFMERGQVGNASKPGAQGAVTIL